VTSKNDPGFKDQFGFESRYMQVGKKDRLIAIYPATKTGTQYLTDLGKKDKTWVFLAALYYD